MRPLEQATTFAVYAPAATRVVLEFYAAAAGYVAEIEFDMARGADGVWRANVGNVGHGTLSTRLHGPSRPATCGPGNPPPTFPVTMRSRRGRSRCWSHTSTRCAARIAARARSAARPSCPDGGR
ncbi:hypothetical protein [Ammonicoccus fulvus]|uniref:hypothetical protein n=1 Tax=Ammonicoccus fulvus TaxID=3138240 RepID=UPI003CC7FC02